MADTARDMAALIEKMGEFERLAIGLEVPMAERLGILNVAEDVYIALCNGCRPSGESIKPELDRRLSYALPLMRRLASVSPGRAGAAKIPDVGRRAA